jgi:hypothetical protein
VNRGKVLAAGFCAIVLGLQAFAAFQRADADDVRYWPFLNYPMYAPSHQRGEQILKPRLFVAPCDSPTVRASRSFSDLHLPQYRFQETLLRAATGPPAVARRRAEQLRTQLSRYGSSRSCRMEIEIQSFTIGPNGLELPGSPWRLARAWTLSDSAAVPAKDSPPFDAWR